MLVGQWQILTLPVDWLLQLNEAGQLTMATSCGELQGAYNVDSSSVSFGPFNLRALAGCSGEQMTQLQDLQLQLSLVVSWTWVGDEQIALNNSVGELVLEMQKQAP